jgi:hypothetical protein
MSQRVSCRLAERVYLEASAAACEAWHAWEASGMSEAALRVAERLELEFFLTLDKYADACEKRRMRFQA